MSQDQGVPQTSADTGAAKTAPPAGAPEVAAESRTFKPAEAASAPTNVEAAAGGVPQTREGSEFWRDALAPLLAAQMETSQWLDRFWRHSGLPSSLTPSFAGRLTSPGLGLVGGMPVCDLKETEKDYQLAVELPGMGREDVDVEIVGDSLRIRGHKAQEKSETRADYRISERRYGRFERSFPLPPDAKRDAITATHADGVLKVVVPRSQTPQAETTKIPIA
ncbi:MAG TPA: Hsp20/alpha crystallin family protein [Phenylobacterium sp.]|nr:Hsp20/alpha crystallin family protein [Phenylobacterium sp.]